MVIQSDYKFTLAFVCTNRDVEINVSIHDEVSGLNVTTALGSSLSMQHGVVTLLQPRANPAVTKTN